MQATLKTDKGIQYITVTIPVNKKPSASGKTTIVASSGGNMATSVIIDGKPVVIGLNAYIK